MDKLTATIRSKSTETILACILAIGGAMEVTQEQRIVRAALLTVYEEREGSEAAEMVMDQIGL